MSGSEFALHLASAERLFQGLFDNNQDGFALMELKVDEQGNVLDARNVASNPALQTHTGLDPEAIRGVWGADYLPELEQAWLDRMTEVLRTGETRRIEQYQKDTDRWYEVVYFPVDGLIIGQFVRDVSDRHRAELQVEESQARFRLLAENSSDIVFSATPGHHAVFTWVSPSCQRMLGWAPGDLIGRTVQDYVHAEDQKDLLEALRRVDGSGMVSAEARWAAADGGYHWFSLRLHRVPDPLTGDPIVVGGGRLIDTERRARERMRRSEAQLKATLDSLIDPHVVLQAMRDRQGVISDFVVLDANEAACRQSTLPYHELVGARFADLAPAVSERLLPALGDVVESGEPLVLDDFAEIIPPDEAGRPPRRFDLRAVKVNDGLSYTWRDVTDRYQARQQIFASEERFRLTVASVPTGIAVLDLDGRFDFVNPAFCSILRRSGDWLLRRDMQQVLYPGEYSKLRHMIGLLTSGSGPVQQAQQRFVTADGTPVEARHTVALLHRADGEPVGFLSHVQPIGADDGLPQQHLSAARSAIARTSVLVTAEERGTFNAICTTALLAQRPEFISLAWAPGSELRARLSADSPDVLVVLAGSGVAGAAQLAQVLSDVETVAPHTGLVVLSGNNRSQLETMLRQRTGPAAFLPITSLRSADVLAQAIATVSQGMGAFDRAAIDALIGRYEPPTDSRLRRLSDREQEVLTLLAEGLDNKTIATRLFVSVKACENYIGSIFRKLGLNADDGTNRRVRATLMYLGER